MLQTIIASLIVAVITSLAFIAYKHHQAYARIYNIFMIAFIAFGIFFIIWNAAFDFALIKLFSYSPEFHEEKEIRKYLTNCKIPFIKFMLLILSFIYLETLKNLHNFLHKKQKEKPK